MTYVKKQPLSPVTLQIRMRKWRWIGHSLGNGNESIEKQALDWNPQETRKGRPRETSKRTVLEEAVKWGKTCSEVKRLAGGRVRWRCLMFLMERKAVL